MNKKLITSCIALAMTISMSTTVLASPSDELKNNQDKLKQSQNLLNNTKQNIKGLEIQIEKLDSKIEGAMRNSQKTKTKIEKSKKDIEKSKKDIEKAEKDIQKQKNLYKKRLNIMYVNGDYGYMNVIFQSKGLSDLFSKMESVSKIQNFDKKVLKGFTKKKNELNKKKENLFLEKSKLESFQKQQKAILSKFQQDKDVQSKLIEEQKQVQASQENQVSKSKAQIDNVQKQIEEQMEQKKSKKVEEQSKVEQQNKVEQSQDKNKVVQKTTNTSEKNVTKNNNNYKNEVVSRGGSVSGNDIVTYAYRFKNVRYVSGGTTPSGFDCSGFAQYVYRHFGIGLSRTTYTQVKQGHAVSRSQLQAGDLIFFGSAANVHHVGIYVGGNCYIHAPHTGDVVKVSCLNRSDYYAARRIL